MTVTGASFGRGNWAARSAGRVEVLGGATPISTSWVPLEHQAPLLSIDQGVILAIGAIGSGKSEPGALKLLEWALRHPRRKDGRPTKWFAIGPDFSLLRREQFGKILEHAHRLLGPKIVKRVVGGQDPRIVLVHDQEILGRSASDPDRLRGHEIDGFWFDEVQRQSTDKAFQIAFSRMRSAAEIRAVLTGSVEDQPRWIWRLLEGKDPKTRAFRATVPFYGFRWTIWQNKSNNPAVTRAIVANMGAASDDPQAVVREGRGLFPGTREAPLLGVVDVTRGFPGPLRLTRQEASAAAMGVDLAETGDFCWLTVLSREGVVLAMDRFNASHPAALPVGAGYWSWVEDRVRSFAETWGVQLVAIDSAKTGAGMVDGYADNRRPIRGARVERVATGAPGKRAELIETAALALSKGDLRVPSTWSIDGREVEVEWVDYLAKEWGDLRPKESNGKRTWPPRGARGERDKGHDDGVISLALAWQALSELPRETELVNPADWGVISLPGGRRRFS